MSLSTLLISLWLFMKTGYYVFYSISYKVENELNKWIKVGNMAIIFMHTVFMVYSLFNHTDERQHELCYLAIFIIVTLLILNVIVALNPIMREEGIDLLDRSCCSSTNLMPTISCLFCFQVLELHHFFGASEAQNTVFYTPFHWIIIIWIFSLWIHIQKLPERFFPESRKIQLYLSSDIIKSCVAIVALMILQLKIRDALYLQQHASSFSAHSAASSFVPSLASAVAPAMTSESSLQLNRLDEISQTKEQLKEAKL